MLVDTIITNARTGTSHDSDTQITGDQWLAWVQLEQGRLRAKLSAAVKSLFTTTASTTLSGSTVTIAKAADFLSLVRIEKLVGSRYFPVPGPYDVALSTHGLTGIEFREEATNFVITPVESAPGTYRVTYVTKGSTLTSTFTTVPGANATVDLPEECEDLLTERVMVRARERCLEDPAANEMHARDIWIEVLPILKKRYGKHPVSGLVRARGDT